MVEKKSVLCKGYPLGTLVELTPSKKWGGPLIGMIVTWAWDDANLVYRIAWYGAGGERHTAWFSEFEFKVVEEERM